MKKFRK